VTPRKFRTKPKPNGIWYEVESVTYQMPGSGTTEQLRVRSLPGRYLMGEFATHEEIEQTIHDFKLADLEPVYGDDE
jgi:hypothetical protein